MRFGIFSKCIIFMMLMCIIQQVQAKDSPLTLWVTSDPVTYEVRADSTFKKLNSSRNTRARVGGSASSGTLSVVYPFELPALSKDMDIESASLVFSYIKKKGNPDFSVNIWAMGIGKNPNNSVQKEFKEKWEYGKKEKIQEGLITSETPEKPERVSTNTKGQERLLDYVRRFYKENPSYKGGKYLIISLSPSVDVGKRTVGYEVRTSPHDHPPELILKVGPAAVTKARRQVMELAKDTANRVWQIGIEDESSSEFSSAALSGTKVMTLEMEEEHLNSEKVLEKTNNVPAMMKGSISNKNKVLKLEIVWKEKKAGYRVLRLHTVRTRTFLGRPKELKISTPDGSSRYFDMAPQRRNTFAHQFVDIQLFTAFKIKRGKNKLEISIPRKGSVASLEFDFLELLSISRNEYAEQLKAELVQDKFEKHLEECAIAYNKAICEAAKVREMAEQCRRLSVYSQSAGKETAETEKRSDLEKRLTDMESKLGADRRNSWFYLLDYKGINKELNALKSEWTAELQNANMKFKGELPAPTVLDDAPGGVLSRFTISMHSVGTWILMDRMPDEWLTSIFANYTGGRFRRPSFFMDLVDRLEKNGFTHMWKIGNNDIYGETSRILGYERDLTLHQPGQPLDRERYRNINFWHPKIQKGTLDLIKETVKRTKGLSYFSGYELFNEPNISISGQEITVRKAWWKWLAKEYKNITALNSHWKASFKSFKEVKPPASIYPLVGMNQEQTAKVYYWNRFCCEEYNNYNRGMINAIRKYDKDPKHIIVPQIIASVFGHHHAKGHNGIDLYTYGALPWSAISSHAWDGNRAPKTSLTTYSIARLYNKPIWEDEYIWSAWSRKVTPEREMRSVANRNLWKKAAWGARGIHLFNTAGDQVETGGNWNNAIFSVDDGSEHLRYAVAAMPLVEKKINRFTRYYYGMWMRWQGLGILQPDTSLIVGTPNMTSRDDGDALLLYLLPLGYRPVNFPEQAFIDGKVDMKKLKVLLVPYSPNLLPKAGEVIRKWVHDGGTLISSGPIGGFDETGVKTPDFLKKIFGIDGIKYAGKDVVRAREQNFNIVNRLDTAGRKWVIEGAPSGTVEVLDRYKDGSPRTLAATYGKGRVVMNLETFSGSKQLPLLKREIDKVLPQRMITLSARSCDWALWETKKADQQVLFIFNNGLIKDAKIDVGIAEDITAVWDLTIKKPVQVPILEDKEKKYFKTALGAGEGTAFLLIKAKEVK